ncbi:DNA replication protein DnaC [Pedobacter sp. AK017]|jgi:DNA replication protein DnaC|uniref:IS21-like element helper ATPase IstB n=1 Tax=Pedobacter sp. AK017 TaxID=2723073 RepID=UPI00161458D5|nr:IS21-like element helper ATPase IstB [Pedobacter sp. AK017]MBB5440467.1 DNA replication protein DnaC [Pedobacter sp. AK017]
MISNNDTLDKFRQLKLWGMYHTFKTILETAKTNSHTPDQLIAELIQAETEYRMNKRISQAVIAAKFRHKFSIEQINFYHERNIDRNQIMRLAECKYIDAHENIIITGPTGIGKSYLACALGYQACVNGYKVLFWGSRKLFTKLKLARADGSYIKEMAKIERCDLLILDDFGIDPFDAVTRAMLMEIIEDREQKTSLILTSQLPVKAWFDMIGEKTIADAVLDRIVHDAHRIEASGESLRKIKAKKADTEESTYE